MKLEDIGFYTLSDKRADNTSIESSLKRCELILSDKCNFKCPYCRGLKTELKGDLTFKEAKHIVDLWSEAKIENIRFSGGEPTLWKDLVKLVKYTKKIKSIKHIAISTNGSASIQKYRSLIKAGVNDFSISLDSCCSSTANKMAGVKGQFNHIEKVIKYISKQTYCTVGVVLTKVNNNELENIIKYATSLGVSDIRIIPSAQSNHKLKINIKTNYKILKYRINNIKNKRHVRGLKKTDYCKCPLVKDDMVIVKNKHYPCIIYMREQGKEIGTIDNKSIKEIRKERELWFKNHNTFKDSICRKNCLDVCIDYNNKVKYFDKSK